MTNETESASPVKNGNKGVLKSRWFKITSRILVGLAIALVVVFFFLICFLGSVIKTSVEKIGSAAFKNTTTVENVDLSLLRGTLLIENLVVGNPEGYKSERAIYLGRIYVKLDVKSVFSKKIHVNIVDIDDPQITYEIGGLTETNIGVLLGNLKKFTGGNKPAKAEKKDEKPSSGGKGVVIDRVEVNGAKVTLAARFLGGSGAPIPLPPIALNDLGKEKEGGVTIVDACTEIMTKVLSSVTDACTAAGKGVVDGVKSLLGK